MADETPWALLKRLKSEGASPEVAVSTLRAQGLSSEDLKLLVDGSPEMEAWLHGAPLPADEPVEEMPAPAPVPTYEVVAPRGVPGLPSLSGGLNLKRWAGLATSVGLVGGAFLWTNIGLVHVITGFCSAVIAVGVWLTTRQETFPGIPDVMPDPVTVFELDDVQFAVFVPKRQTLGLGHSFEVTLLVQNIVDARRTLAVALNGRTSLISSPLLHRFELEPGVVAELTIPYRLRSLDSGWLDFDVAVAVVSHGPGRRLRTHAGETWVSVDDSARTNALGIAKLALLGEGEFILGANGRFSVKFDTELPAEQAERATAPRALRWGQPRPGVLE
ncbi:MAG: hypothetical protein MUC96_30685 [Myxococcaceae bacterium]|jgi:hypothetical protein|nr:hypothetical protein [Myxococcaceae bacterium]